LPEDIQRIFDVAMQKLAFQTALTFEVENAKAARELMEEGVTLYDWSVEDRAAFRQAAQTNWQRWADKTPEARALVDSHIEFMNVLGLLD
jgi:TRAP-type mannitol/chloroaromatic compound transport system substrate-binding protein